VNLTGTRLLPEIPLSSFRVTLQQNQHSLREVQMTPEVQAIPEVQVVSEVQVTSSPQMADIPTDNNQGTAVVNGSEDDVQTGSTDSVTLFILAIFGLLVAQRRRLPAH